MEKVKARVSLSNIACVDRQVKEKGLINKLIIECDCYEDAQRILNKANNRIEFRHVKIHLKRPKFNELIYFHSYIHFKKLGKIWKNKIEKL